MNVFVLPKQPRGEDIEMGDDGSIEKSDVKTVVDEKDRPTIHMFSATMPQSVSNLAKTYLHHPVYVQIGDVDKITILI